MIFAVDPTFFTPGLDGDTLDVCRRMDVPPAAARVTIIDTLVKALKAGSVWDKLDLLYLFAAHDAQAARLNWINPDADALTAGGSPTFTADSGYTGDGSSAYLAASTNVTALSHFSQDSAHIGIWSLTDANNDAYYDIGVNTGSNLLRFNPRNSGTSIVAQVNSSTSQTVSPVTGTSGHYLMNRTGASATEIFKNASSLGTDTDASTTPPAAPFTFLANRPNNTPSFSTRKLMAGHVGQSLSSGEVTALYNALNAYKTSVGA